MLGQLQFVPKIELARTSVEISQRGRTDHQLPRAGRLEAQATPYQRGQAFLIVNWRINPGRIFRQWPGGFRSYQKYLRACAFYELLLYAGLDKRRDNLVADEITNLFCPSLQHRTFTDNQAVTGAG